jgi:hypothetical protein
MGSHGDVYREINYGLKLRDDLTDHFSPSLSEERDVCGNTPLVGEESVAEVGSEQTVFNAHTNLRARQQDDDGNQEQPPGCNEDSSAKEHAQHGCVNGMTDYPIWSGGDEIMIRIETRFNSPLFPRARFRALVRGPASLL